MLARLENMGGGAPTNQTIKQEPAVSTLSETDKKARKERINALEQLVWQNLKTSEILAKILEKSAHADDISRYVGVKFWAEISVSRETYKKAMWIQIFIEHDTPVQPVTPKLYRITQDAEEQRLLSERIWDGVTPEDLLLIIKAKADMFHKRGEERGLDIDRDIIIKKLYPAIMEGRITIELLSDYAQYRVTMLE